MTSLELVMSFMPAGYSQIEAPLPSLVVTWYFSAGLTMLLPIPRSVGTSRSQLSMQASPTVDSFLSER